MSFLSFFCGDQSAVLLEWIRFPVHLYCTTGSVCSRSVIDRQCVGVWELHSLSSAVEWKACKEMLAQHFSDENQASPKKNHTHTNMHTHTMLQHNAFGICAMSQRAKQGTTEEMQETSQRETRLFDACAHVRKQYEKPIIPTLLWYYLTWF